MVDFDFDDTENGMFQINLTGIPDDIDLSNFDLSKYKFDKGNEFPCYECDSSGQNRICKEGPLKGRFLYCDCNYGRRKHLSELRRMESCFNNCGIPKRLHGLSIETAKNNFPSSVFNSTAWKVFLELKDNFQCTDPRTQQKKEGITILGANGVGKSGCLVILAREYYKFGLTPLYIKYIDLVKKGVQSGYSEYNKQDVQMSHIRSRIACNCDVLIIDDLGDPFEYRDQQETKDRREILFNIISHRHENELPTLFSGNYKNLDAISKQFSPRIASRIKEMTAIVTLRNRDLRE